VEWFAPPYPVRQTVIVNTAEQSFRGVLWQKTREWLELRNAELLKGRGEIVKMDGSVLIYRDRVEFVQILPSGAHE
jgi:hypothetical protein